MRFKRSRALSSNRSIIKPISKFVTVAPARPPALFPPHLSPSPLLHPALRALLHAKPAMTPALTPALIPFGTAHPESYFASREIARAAAVAQGFDEVTFVEQPVRWGDQDGNNHVNNCVYFKWLEAGRLAFMGLVPGAFPEGRAGKGKGMILGAAGINYLVRKACLGLGGS